MSRVNAEVFVKLSWLWCGGKDNDGGRMTGLGFGEREPRFNSGTGKYLDAR